MDSIAIAGASGLVGEELISLLKQSENPPKKIELISRNHNYNFKGVDIVFLCTPASVAKIIAPLAIAQGAIVIDLSSAYRLAKHARLFHPLVSTNVEGVKLFSIPNCVASIMLCILAPLNRENKITRIFASTYQAASGAGKKGLDELIHGDTTAPTVFPHPYKHNIFLHEDSQGEEEKIIAETRRILNNETLGIHVRTIRVPVIRAHSMTLNVSFKYFIDAPGAMKILKQAPGVVYQDSPNPKEAEKRHEVFYGPIRIDQSLPNTLDFWVCGDQLLRGAALNALACYNALSATAVNK